MPDSCATCFFCRLGCCHFNAPEPDSIIPRAPIYQWPSVPHDGWCAQGVDSTTLVAFMPKVKPQ